VNTNRYPGTCHVCSQPVPAGQGSLVRLSSGYKVQCSDCAKNRMTYRPRMPGKKRWR
jgi:hypothetical protein